jgi:Transcriptional regulator
MGIAERRQNEIQSIKKKIIEAAGSILVEEGYEKLSIRKIARKIEYSPGIIYHYFADKAEIVAFIVEEGYGNILRKIAEVPIDAEKPQSTIEQGLRIYIDLMLENPEQFRAVLMNNIEEIQSKVNILERGISEKRKSIAMLSSLITLGIEKGIFREMDAELTAQILWTSTHGLVSRLILEKSIKEEQKQRLINHHFEMIINGLLKN